ncbi:hypothetical protein PV08_03377 [Exophiala spinifera]|uniref:Uncharacterized protein n=1 Tax=Exophiala spinifera TaxID=91928 RepID=A0A0D2BKJ4_9EURO|nr:uncharacterized protein PV08_03377 [Exophiala spinifera]KIW19085.1 hypothetical protein PV08_03377 [Exophiala spinifera]
MLPELGLTRLSPTGTGLAQGALVGGGPWIKDVKKPARQPRRNKADASPQRAASSSPESVRASVDAATTSARTIFQPSAGYTPTHSSDSGAAIPVNSPPTNPQTSLDSVSISLGSWFQQVFESCWEQIFGFWLGRDCCPFIWDPSYDVVFPPSKLFAELDAAIDQDWEARNLEDAAATPLSQRLERNCQIEDSLKLAIRSFASQWLHLIPKQERADIIQEDLVRELWRASRRDMLKVINRVSYRSVLTLFIFGLTPIPVGVSKDEETDGLTGQVCLQIALQQVQSLRERQRNCQFSGSKVSFGLASLVTSKPKSFPISEAFLNGESRAYWGALEFDTSASLTLNFRSSLSSGLHGVGSESAWRVLRTGAHSFQTRTKDWRTSTFEVSDDTASQIVAAAAACKVFVFKMIAVLKEALREGEEEDKVKQAWDAFTEAADIFQDAFRPLLSSCERRLHFLSQVERLNWYEVMLHYHLGILMLVDTVEAAERDDLLVLLKDKRLDAEQEVVNALKFGLESTLTIRAPADDTEYSERPRTITASFIQLDPYPHHIVAAVQLMNKVISREFRHGKIKLEIYKYLGSTLSKALNQLPQTSRSVQEARQYLNTSFQELEHQGDVPRLVSPAQGAPRPHRLSQGGT